MFYDHCSILVDGVAKISSCSRETKKRNLPIDLSPNENKENILKCYNIDQNRHLRKTLHIVRIRWNELGSITEILVNQNYIWFASFVSLKCKEIRQVYFLIMPQILPPRQAKWKPDGHNSEIILQNEKKCKFAIYLFSLIHIMT